MLIFALLVFAVYKLYQHIEKHVKALVQQDLHTNIMSHTSSIGLPSELEASWQQAAKSGPAAMSNWLRIYSYRVPDPYRASMELDYCEKVAWVNPAEAKRVFAAVKTRTGTNSPVFNRVKQLEAVFR